MANLRIKFLYIFFSIAMLTFTVFTCICAQGQEGRSEESAPGAAGSQGGMPEGGPGGSNLKITAAAIYVDDGAYQPEKSTKTSVSGGKIGNTSASGVKIASKADNFNGIYVKGYKSIYTLSDSTIDLSGNGTGDISGVGAAAMAGDGGTLILKNVKITTNGILSSAAFSKSNGTIKVYDSTLETKGGKNLVFDRSVAFDPLTATPTTSRATNTVDNSESYFYNCTIKAAVHGALSTDGASGYVYVEANNCDIQTIKGGYGTYADIACTVVLNDCKITTEGETGIIASYGKIYLNNDTINAGGSCIRIHNVMDDAAEIETLQINGGTINTKNAVVLISSANADIVIDGAELNPQNGVLIQAEVNDDKNASKIKYPVMGIRAILKRMNLKGDIIHEDTERTMKVILVNTNLKGAVNGASLSLVGQAKWTATADSNVTLVDSVDIIKIDALKGVTITAQGGRGCQLKGTYKLESGGTLKVTQSQVGGFPPGAGS